MFDIRYKSHHDAEAAYRDFTKPVMRTQEELEQFLQNTSADDREHVIYIHVPFCDRICSFCNLNRKILNGATDEYTEKLIAQIHYYGGFAYTAGMKVGSVYFGGGTPTVLTGQQFQDILGALRANFHLVPNCEITSESTLHNLTPEKLAQMEQAGVNRLSIGIQTFSTEGRKFFNRTGDKAYAMEKLAQVRALFPHTVAIDKIYNYPGETMESLLEDVRIIKETGIDSVSFYSLMIQTGSALSKKLGAESMDPVSDLQYHNAFVQALLSDESYTLLEITKIAKKGADNYRYISLRNSGADTLPMGEGGGGSLGSFGIFQMNFERRMIAGYSPEKILADGIYGLMQKGRFTQDEIQAITGAPAPWAAQISEELEKAGMLEETQAGYRLTPNGLFYGNNVCAAYVVAFLKHHQTAAAV